MTAGTLAIEPDIYLTARSEIRSSRNPSEIGPTNLAGWHLTAAGFDRRSATSPVGIHPKGASPYGVLDMGGNTTEWVYDVWGPYPKHAVTDPIGYRESNDLPDRAMRGGFWIAARGSLTPTEEDIDEAHTTRSDVRAGDDPRSSDDHLGFRVAIDYCPR